VSHQILFRSKDGLELRDEVSSEALPFTIIRAKRSEFSPTRYPPVLEDVRDVRARERVYQVSHVESGVTVYAEVDGTEDRGALWMKNDPNVIRRDNLAVRIMKEHPKDRTTISFSTIDKGKHWIIEFELALKGVTLTAAEFEAFVVPEMMKLGLHQDMTYGSLTFGRMEGI